MADSDWCFAGTMSSPWSPLSIEEDEEIQELGADEQQVGEQLRQGDGQQQELTAEARAQETVKKRARSVSSSSTNPSNSRKSEVWKDFKFTRRSTRVLTSQEVCC